MTFRFCSNCSDASGNVCNFTDIGNTSRKLAVTQLHYMYICTPMYIYMYMYMLQAAAYDLQLL